MEGLLLHIGEKRFLLLFAPAGDIFSKRGTTTSSVKAAGKSPYDVIVTAVETLFSLSLSPSMFTIFFLLPFFLTATRFFFSSTRGTRPDALRVWLYVLIPYYMYSARGKPSSYITEVAQCMYTNVARRGGISPTAALQ